MTLDKEDHRALLIQLIEQSNFPGKLAELVVEVKDALRKAEIRDAAKG